MPDHIPLANEPGRLTTPPPDASDRPADASDRPPDASDRPADATDRLRGRPADPLGGRPADPLSGLPAAAGEMGTPRWEILYGSVFLAVLAVLAVVALSAGSERRALVAISASAVMALWYFVVGRPYLRAPGDELNRRSMVYLTGIVVLFGVAVLATPNAWFVSIAVLPQIYQILPPRRALFPALLVTALGAASVAYWSQDAAGIGIAIALFVAVGAFTVAFGGYIGRIITQSDERASLIAQLEATRTELADVSRQAGVMAERQRLAGAAEPGIAVVGEAASGDEVVAMASQHRPDVVLMDLRMPRGDGVAATAGILAVRPDTRIVVLTTYETDADIVRAVEAGATGYLLEDTPRADLVAAIMAAARGETVLGPTVAWLVSRLRRPAVEPLSARETEVLALVARGQTNVDIGRALFISEATVKTHLLRAFGKLGVSDRTAAVTTAIELGMLPAPGSAWFPS